jgi:multiple sugar transport system permease protein/raffinose/stachyose/melibiose transport system permease protein
MNVYTLRRAAYRTVLYVVLSLLAIIALMPLYFSAVNSLKTPDTYAENKLWLPADPAWQNYEYALIDARLYEFAVNSIIMLPVALALYIGVCSAAGFAFGHLRFRRRLALFTLVLFLMIFPQMMLSVPVFRIVAGLGLLDTRIGAIFVWVAYFSPYGTYIMSTFFSTVPRSLYESAKIDGAGIGQVLRHIMVPVATPMVATITMLGFQGMWNELPFSLLILRSEAKRTLTLGIAMMQGQYGLPDTTRSAAVIIASVVPLMVFAIAQRQIRSGATMGAVKG